LGAYNAKLAAKYGPDLESKRQAVLHPVIVDWTGGFSNLESEAGATWHWCSSEGEIVINNILNQQRTFKLDMGLATGYEELANLSLDGDLISEKLKINVKPTVYSRTITLPP